MTITTTGAKKVFSANGATTVFGWDFYVPDQASLVVQSVAADGTTSVVSTGFTITGLGSASGSVTFAVAPASGTQIVLSRSVALTQGTDLTNQDGFYPEVLEASLDKLTMIAQQVQEQVGRAIKANIADSITITLPTQSIRLNKYLAFDGTGQAIAIGDTGDQASILANKVAAQAAQAAAETARDATLAAYDSFDDRYLGPKSSNPTLDNDGNALIAGSLYYNTAVPEMRLYTGAVWVAAYVSGGSFLPLHATADAAVSLNIGSGQAIFAYGTVGYVVQSATGQTSVQLQFKYNGATVGGYIYVDAGGIKFLTATAGNALAVDNSGNFTAFGSISDTKGDVRTLPFTTQRTAAYVAAATDAGQTIPITTGGVTINTGVFSANQIFSIYNESDSTQTLTQGTSVTLRKMGVASITGNMTIPARGYVTIHARSSTEFLVSGVS